MADPAVRDELVTILLECPMLAIGLGMMAEEDFAALMRKTHRKLRQQALARLAQINQGARSYEEILERAMRVTNG